MASTELSPLIVKMVALFPTLSLLLQMCVLAYVRDELLEDAFRLSLVRSMSVTISLDKSRAEQPW